MPEVKVAPSAYAGIPFHLRFATPEQELTREPRVVEAVARAREIGWRGALEQDLPELTAYCTDPRRSQFLDVLPLTQDMRVLEIGIGLGQHTVEIARRVASVDAIELRLANALFAKLRAEQDGLSNIAFHCGGDDCRLPFADAQYDAVILNLVLEWCGSANGDEPHVASQERLLREIHRVLKPRGLAQINTKNRYALRLVMGGRDEHWGELRFGSALPRWLTPQLTRRTPAGCLHSHAGLSKLLRRAGLEPAQAYWTVPEMRFARHFVPADAPSVRDARRRISRLGESRLTDALIRRVPASWVKHLAPGHFIVAHRSDPGTIDAVQRA